MKIHTVIMLIILFLSGCAGKVKTGITTEISPGHKSSPDKEIITYWFDKETSTVHKMMCKSGEKRIISIVKYYKGEPIELMKIIKSANMNGRLHWAYFVPSTKYIVELSTLSITENKITIEWKNRTGDGVEKSGRDILIECNQFGIIPAGKNGEKESFD